jgi:hypothetical protein
MGEYSGLVEYTGSFIAAFIQHKYVWYEPICTGIRYTVVCCTVCMRRRFSRKLVVAVALSRKEYR